MTAVDHKIAFSYTINTATTLKEQEMTKYYQVSFRIAGTRQEIWIQDPRLNAAVIADTGDCGDLTMIADDLVHTHISGQFGHDVELELDEIYDGDDTYSIELWDYSDGPVLVQQQLLEAA